LTFLNTSWKMWVNLVLTPWTKVVPASKWTSCESGERDVCDDL
jgi:hypothetical protein